MTNDELRAQIRAVAAGDLGAFEQIYKDLSKPLYTVILRITREKSSAEDVLQELFVKLFTAPPVSAKNPRAYLFQTAHNLAVDAVRKRPQEAGSDDFEHLTYSPDADILERVAVEDALKALPAVERQIVSLHVSGGLTFREISKILSLPLGTALWRYRKAIGQLREYLSGGNV